MRITFSVLLALLNVDPAWAALCSRTLTFVDGNVLTASQLNSEFSNSVDCVNSITDANIAGNAAIDAAKISASIAGDGVTRNSSGALSVNVDNSTIELNADALRLKDNAVSTAKIQDNAVTRAKLAVVEQTPIGSVMAYAATSAPAGWLSCDGGAVSRVTYASLFAVIGITHGAGDGVNTFNVPDYRGRFLRGVDGGAGRDPSSGSRSAMAIGGNTGNAVGSLEGGATKLPNTAFTTDNPGDHTHTLPPAGLTNSTSSGASWSGGFIGMNTSGTSVSLPTNAAGAHAHTVVAGGDAETRPINAYVNYIIKY